MAARGSRVERAQPDDAEIQSRCLEAHILSDVPGFDVHEPLGPVLEFANRTPQVRRQHQQHRCVLSRAVESVGNQPGTQVAAERQADVVLIGVVAVQARRQSAHASRGHEDAHRIERPSRWRGPQSAQTGHPLRRPQKL